MLVFVYIIIRRWLVKHHPDKNGGGDDGTDMFIIKEFGKIFMSSDLVRLKITLDTFFIRTLL